jgi:transcriptional regulator with XRE-family HTH domain
MTLANGLFAQVLDYLVKEGIIKDQQELSIVTGITETTISRILNDKVRRPSNETWQKLNAAFGNIFNPQYFRGESPIMLVADIMPEQKTQQNPISNDHFDLVKAALEAKDETIEALREQIETKDELIAALRQQIQTLQQQEYLKDFPVGTVEGIEKQDQVRV